MATRVLLPSTRALGTLRSSVLLRPSALLVRPMPQPAHAPPLVRWLCSWEAWEVGRVEQARARQESFAKERAEQQAARAKVKRTPRPREKISVLDGMLEGEFLEAKDFLALIQSLEPKKVQKHFSSKVGWNHYDGIPDGSVALYTIAHYNTKYGNFAIREYYAEWEREQRYTTSTRIYARRDHTWSWTPGMPDIMQKIVDIMKASGRFTSVGGRRPGESVAAYEERKKGELF